MSFNRLYHNSTTGWQWTDGTPLDYGFDSVEEPTTGIEPWNSGEPDNDGSDLCVLMFRSTSPTKFLWTDKSCANANQVGYALCSSDSTTTNPTDHSTAAPITGSPSTSPSDEPTYNPTIFPSSYPSEGPTTNSPTTNPPTTYSPTGTPSAPSSSPSAAPTDSTVHSSTKADLTLYCDDQATVYLSHNGKGSWTNVGRNGFWTTPFMYEVTNISSDTVLRVSCQDLMGPGALIATMQYNGQNYSTTEPLNESFWDLINSTDGITSRLVYYNKTTSPWTGLINITGIASDAKWVWNGNAGNTMLFEFAFDALITTTTTTTPPTGDPTMEPTRYPTSEPIALPTAEPTDNPTIEPPKSPSFEPTTTPTTTSPTQKTWDAYYEIELTPYSNVDSINVSTSASTNVSDFWIKADGLDPEWYCI